MLNIKKIIFIIFAFFLIDFLNYGYENFVFASSYNIATVGDWGCTKDSKLLAININFIDPELVLIPGDLSYEKSGKCFFDIINPFASKTKIAIGNHDDIEDGTKKLKNEYLDFFNLKKSFYSFNYQNVHVLVLDTQLDPKNKEQYEFAKYDLRKTNNNDKIEWIIVMFHKPMYSSGLAHEDFEDFTKIYHPLFDEFKVNLAIQGHNHIYERTLPLKYSDDDPKIIGEKIKRIMFDELPYANTIQDVQMTFEPNKYENSIDVIDSIKGTVFVTIGTGGRGLHDTEDKKPQFIETVYNEAFGFLDLQVDDKKIIGTYYSLENIKKSNEFNKMNIRDKFILTKELPLVYETNYLY